MLENLVQTTIRKEDLDIDYNGHTATNHFGTRYNVTIEKSESCFDVSRIDYFNKEITLKTSCDKGEDQGHFLAHNLAHELGHSEVYLGTNMLFAIIGTVGIMHAFKKRSVKTFFYTAASLSTYKLFVEESIAEFAASKFHDTVYLDFHGDIAKIISFGTNLIDLL